MNRSFEVVAIWEAAYHNEVLEAYVHYLHLVSNKIILFTHHFQFEQAVAWRDKGNVEWIIKDDQTKWKEFFQAQHVKLSGCTWLLTTSLPEENTESTPIVFPCPAWLVVHNAMFSLGKNKRQFYMGEAKLKDLLKIIRYHWQNKSTQMDRIMRSFDNVIFPTKTIKEYCLSQKVYEQKGAAVIPFYYPKGLVKKPDENQFTIVIPGTVNPEIRDYKLIASIIPMILAQSPLPVQLILLGKCKGHNAEKIVKQISTLADANFQCKVFTDFIPQEIFEVFLGKADLIVAPLLETTRYDAVEEKFGFTTESGNIADIISYQIPGVLPAFYPFPEEFSGLIDRYDSAASLIEIIRKKIQSKSKGQDVEKDFSFPPAFSKDVANQLVKQWHDFRTFDLDVNHG